MSEPSETDSLLREGREVSDGTYDDYPDGCGTVLNAAPPEQPSGCGATLLCDPRRWAHRYFVLILMCLLGFGSYFSYDNPAALAKTIEDDMSLTTSQYMMFYSLYSWPNVILCIVGGFLLDRVFGVCWGTIIFSSILTVGQVLFALGALVGSYALMCTGRFVFGIGGSSLSIAQCSYAVNWFQGHALSMAFGLQLSFSRIGSTLNLNMMQKVYDSLNQSYHGHVRLGLTLFVGVGICVFSLLCAFIVGYFDKRLKRLIRTDLQQSTANERLVSFRDVKDFGGQFWTITIICVAYYVTIFPFIGLGTVFFLNKFELEPSAAAAVDSLVYLISAVGSPVFGFLIDLTGLNVFWVLGGVLLAIVSHALLAFTFLTPWVAMILLGISYSILASSLWPMVSMVVLRHQIGTAYGIMQAIQNLGLAIISIITGSLTDRYGFLVLEVFFLFCLIVSLIATVVLYMLDTVKGGKLNSAAWKRKLIHNEGDSTQISEPTKTSG